MDKDRISKINICKSLRARNPYGMMEGGDSPWLMLDDANTICWCIDAAGGVGPDNGLVSTSGCNNSRSCFVPRD